MEILTNLELIEAAIDGKKVEVQYDGKNWTKIEVRDITIDILINPSIKFRLAKERITIGNLTFPKPETEPLEYGTDYWVATAARSISSYAVPLTWRNDAVDKRYLSRGLAHLSQDAAIEHAKALIKLSGGKVD